jgi:hypothetical protein
LPESGSNLEPKNHRSSCCCAGTGRGVPRILPGGCTFLADLASPPPHLVGKVQFFALSRTMGFKTTNIQRVDG